MVLARLWLALAGLNGAIGVAAGAHGWHALGGDAMFAIASTYQLVHAAALVGVAWLAARGGGRPGWPATVAGACFALGIVLFTGTLYALVLLGVVLVPGAAPVGGLLLIAGWLALVWAAVTFRPSSGG